ncbi:hypothetical protein QUW17_13930 [Bacteroides gallinaceum]|uniref:hypothetical protein n=1 Tax=Bacteroides gallinaceum TaxID=1462571 RepID=UPI0025A3C84C|nr:hypothetical protein [Bacteroides gallinaceum]MDM8208951.1 hypothetical protein [Bacteroides gallinaceum]
MAQSYYEQFKDLVKCSPLENRFYEKLIRNNFNGKRRYIVFKNITEELLNAISVIRINSEDEDINPSIVVNEKKGKITWRKNELDKKSVSYNLTPKEGERGIREFFHDITGEYAKNFMQDNENLEKYIEACCNLIFNYNDNIKEENLEKYSSAYIKYLYRNPDVGTVQTDYLDFLILLFDNLCQSLLKGEYLTYDIPKSSECRNYKRIDGEYNKIRKNNTEKRQDEAGDASNLTFDRFLTDTADFMTRKTDANLINSIILPIMDRSTDTGEKDEHPFNMYLNIDRMLYDYQVFNEKAKSYSEAKRLQHHFEEDDRYPVDYEKEYISCSRTLLAAPVAFANIMEYLFRLLLEMCLIDHNYIASDKNFKLLMKLHSLLSPAPDPSAENTTYRFPDLLESIKRNAPYINQSHVDNLKETIRLLKVKTDILLLKMWEKTYKNERMTYTARYGNATETETEELYKSEYPCFDIEKEVREQFAANYIDERFNDLLSKKISAREDKLGFEPYEKLFTRLICESQPDYRVLFAYLERIIEQPAHKISNRTYYNVYNYNNVIYLNFIHHFGKYGRYIKRLKTDIRGERNDGYLEDVEHFVKQDDGKEMLSCAFIIKHIKWLLDVLEDSFISKTTSKDSSYDTGFKYIRLAEILLKRFEKLIASIEADTYCMNYSSFFQDCFFCNELEKTKGTEKCKLKRISSEKITFSPEDKESKNVIFISSTWQPPVDLVNLKRRYSAFSSRIQLLTTDFYHKYYQHFITLQETNLKNIKENTERNLDEKVKSLTQEMKVQLTDNKRETVQILGIFAAFLAIATISMEKIGNIASLDTISLIFSICTCFGYFIILLQLITRNTNRMATTIIIGVLTGLLLYCTFSIRNGGQPVKEKQPEKSEAYLPSTTAYDKMLTLSNSHDIYAQTSERQSVQRNCQSYPDIHSNGRRQYRRIYKILFGAFILKTPYI